MAEVVMPYQPFVGQQSAPGHKPLMPTARGNSEPTSPFTYPLPSPNFATAGASHMASASSRETGTGRAADRSRPQHLSLHALPAFEFNPSGSNDSASGSSVCTPTRKTPPSSHGTTGHRRNGSEFIGGDANIGVAALSSASPTKGDFGPEHPPVSRSGPPASRRGHAHRRSGAVSSNDLSHVLRPAPDPRGSSLPSTPSDPNSHHRSTSQMDRSSSQPGLLGSSQDSPPRLALDEDTPAKPYPRARVGFSDTLEFIPRPLSTISSETSSSLSTIRPSHSVTGSISSIVSGGASSPPSAKLGRSLSDPTLEQSAVRSSHQAAASTPSNEVQWSEVPEDHIAMQEPSTSFRPSPQPLATGFSSQSSDSQLEHAAGGAETTSRDAFITKGQTSPLQPYAQGDFSPFTPSSAASSITRPRSSPESKVAKRQKKVKSWAGSLMPRKPRTDEAFKNSPEPTIVHYPQATFASMNDISLENISFDDDTTCVIRDPTQLPPSPRLQHGQAGAAHVPVQDDIASSVLDLDAAFDSPTKSSLGTDVDDISDGGFGAARRRMHSSGATGGFSGPGMHYHRRAESAPEMVQPDYHALGFPRFGSNPKMADVFEEEEEDGQHEEKGDTRSNSQAITMTQQSTSGLGVQIIDVVTPYDDPLPSRSSRRQASNTTEADQRGICQEDRDEAVKPNTALVSDSPIEIVEADEEPRASILDRTPDDYTATPTLCEKPVMTRPASAPIDFALPKASFTSMTPETLSSTVSSPDFSRTSFDGPRLHTARSSITDRTTLNSYRTGEHNINLRASVDDVPSLTSSASTATSAQPPRCSGSAYTCSIAERSSSLSAAVPSTNRPAPASKRSSLASLSRLVGSSYGERSKLHIEERAESESPDKAVQKKRNRISRLMRFWKSREKVSSP